MRSVRVVRYPGMLLLAIGALGFVPGSPATARPAPPSINNLKGTYNGPYTSNNGAASGQLTLKITKDKLDNGTRVIKATAKFDRKTYKLQGAFQPATRQLNLTGVTGRPPNVTLISVAGFFNEAGTQLNGGYQIVNSANPNIGDTTVSR